MEPRKDENKEPRAETNEAKPRRFRIVRLEDRIAPGNGHGNGSNVTCANCHLHTCGGC